MRSVASLEATARRWWPFLASFAAVAVIATMGYVTLSVANDREEQVRAREIAEERNDQLADIIEVERESQETRDERLADAVAQVRRGLAEELAKHDAQVNRLFQRQLAQIGELLNRPEGTPPDPVTARSQPPPAPAPSPPQSSATSPPATSSPTTAAPAPTTPRQRSCERRPGDHRHC